MELLTNLIAKAGAAMEERKHGFSIRKDGVDYTVFGGVKAAKERGDISGYYTIWEVETTPIGTDYLIVELLIKWEGPKKKGYLKGKDNFKVIDTITIPLRK